MDDFDFLEDEEFIDEDDCILDDEFIRDHFNMMDVEAIENFPFVEDDIDAITDYELFSKGFGYLDNKKADKEELNDYAKKSDIPDVSEYVKKDTTELENYTKTSDLSEVALTGDYDDLSNKPTIPSKTSDLDNDSGYITKDVNDLTYYTKTSDLPSVPTKTSQLDNDSGFITKNVNDLTNYTLTTSLSTVATTGNYNDLSNTPTIPDVSNFITKDVNDLTYYTLTTSLSTVATTGNYNDLSNTPTIPTVPTNVSAFNNDSGYITKSVNDLTYYTLSSSLSTVATSGNYNDLSNKPTIPTVNNATLTIQKNGTTVDTFTANASSDKTINITVPTQTSDITNNSGYLTMTSLYHYASGIAVGSANLSDNVANYKKIDIVYHSNDSDDDISVKTLDNPYNGMKSYLDYKFILGNTIYEKIMTITVGTNTITINENAEFQIGSSTITSGNKIFITDVIGYK